MISDTNFDEVFDIRSIISNITIDTVDQQSMIIISSPYCQSEKKLYELFDMIFLFASIRPKQIQALCTLTMSIYSAREDNSILENVRNILISKFHDLGPPNVNPMISCGYFGYLHMCFIQFLLSDEEIVEEINKFVDNHPGAKLHISFICSWFLPEIEKYNNDLFKLITHNYLSNVHNNNNQDNQFSIIKDFYKPKSIEKLKSKDWSYYRDYIFSAYEPNSLGDAIRSDDFEKFKILSNKYGFNINSKLPPSLFLQIPFLQDSPTLVQAAAFFGSLQIFKFLILNNADLKMTDNKKRPLAFYAVAGGSSEIIRTCDQQGLSFKNSIIYAINFQHQDIFNWLLDTLPKDMKPEDILKESSKCGNLELVYDLLVSNMVFSYSDFKFNDFILRLKYMNYLTISAEEAVKGDYSQILEIIIDTNNKDINLDEFKEEEEEEETNDKPAKKIKSSAHNSSDDDSYHNYSDLSSDEDDNRNARHNLARRLNIQLNGRRITINQNNRDQLIRQIPNNDPFIYRKYKQTEIAKKNALKELIYIASQYNSIKCLKILCKELDNDVFYKDNNNITPIHNAAKNGCIEFIQYLLESNKKGIENHPEYEKYDINSYGKYSDGNNSDYDNQKCTPLYLAVLYGHTNIVKYLLDNGALYGKKLRLNEQQSQEKLQKFKIKIPDEEETELNENQNTTDELHIAAREGYIQILKLFLNLNTEFNNIDNNGASALHYAAALGQLESVNLLLSTPGIDPNNSNNENNITPLCLACSGGHYKVVKSFIDYNKKIKQDQIDKKNSNSNEEEEENSLKPALIDVNKPCLYNKTAIFKAIESKSSRTVKALLESDDININIHEEMNESTPLHIACELGLTDIVKAILRYPGIDVNVRDKLMNTPLHIASDRGFAPIVKLILSIEDTEEEKAKKKQEKQRKQEIKEKRKQQKEENAKTENNNNNNDDDEAEEDDEIDESLFNDKDDEDKVEEEEEDNEEEEEEKVIKKFEIEIDAVNKENKTALHYASMNDKSDCLDLLLRYKSPNESALIEVNCKDSQGNTPLIYASIYDNYYNAFKLLRIERTDALAQNNESWTALHFAASKDNDDIIQLLLIRIKSIESSSKNDSKNEQNLHHSLINIQTNGGYTALHLAAAKKAEAAMRVLLEEEEVDVNVRCKNGKTPLHFAATYGFVSGVKMLLDHIPIPKKDTNDNDNENDKDKLVDNAYLTDDIKMTPLMYAQKYKREEIIKLFEKREKAKGQK